MSFSLDARIPLGFQGYDPAVGQRNALMRLQQQAAESDLDERNALNAALQRAGAGLSADDPAKRAAAAAEIGQVGPRGYALAAPILTGVRNERQVASIFGGGAPAPAAPSAAPVAAPGGDVLTRIASVESGGNDGARNPRSSAAGRFQIIDSTWNQYAPRLGLRPDQRMDPQAQEQVARAIQRDATIAVGRDLSPGEQYGAHLLGIGGLRAFVNADPNADAQTVYAQAAGPQIAAQAFQRNPGLLEPGSTVGQVMELLGGRVGGSGATTPAAGAARQTMPGQPTTAQFAQLAQAAAAGNEVAQRMVTMWAPFMRQENALPPTVELGEGPQGPAGVYERRADGLRLVGPRPPSGSGGLTPGEAQSRIGTLAPRIASGQATEQEVRDYLNAVNVATNRISENGTQVVQPLPPFAPPIDAVTRMYPGVVFQPQGAAPAGAPAVSPIAAPGAPGGDAAAAGVQLPAPPGATAPGAGGGVARPPGPGQATSNQIEERQYNATEALARLDGIQQGFRPENQTYSNRWSNMWSSLRERAGAQLSPQERQRLGEYTAGRARAFENLNETIRAATGAAMGVQEADRIIATMPNPGTGMFDGDSPTEFQAKLTRATADLRNALIRHAIARQRGLDPLRSGIALEQVPGIVNRRGEEIEREIRADNPGMPNAQVEQMWRLRLGAELGLR